MDGPTATYTSAARTGHPQSTWAGVNIHSPVVKRVDQSKPKATCATRKVVHSARMLADSGVGFVSIQLYTAQPIEAATM